MVHDAKRASEEDKSDSRQEIDADLTLFLTPIQGNHKKIVFTRKVLLNDMCETLLLVSTNAFGVMLVAPNKNVWKTQVFTTTNGNIDVNQGWPFHITIVNVDRLTFTRSTSKTFVRSRLSLKKYSTLSMSVSCPALVHTRTTMTALSVRYTTNPRPTVWTT